MAQHHSIEICVTVPASLQRRDDSLTYSLSMELSQSRGTMRDDTHATEIPQSDSHSPKGTAPNSMDFSQWHKHLDDGEDVSSHRVSQWHKCTLRDYA